ncbi:MAG: FAD-binding protein [Desulfobacterales bacterium]|jgi:FAD/FMN-containing dehydrogenase
MKEFTKDQIAALSNLVADDRFSVGQSSRELHLHDISAHRGTLPAAIIWPITTEEVSKVLSWAYTQEVPVTPWGAGTSTEGNPVPTRGGLVMNMTQMDKILEIRSQDLQADVQPGVLRKELNRQAGKQGLFFPPDPGADASIGGMIANNASGYVIGHAGDGNLHVVLVGDPNDEKEGSMLENINDQIVGRALELSGTCTGEHGIGKRNFMELEHGQSYHLMRQIKE